MNKYQEAWNKIKYITNYDVRAFEDDDEEIKLIQELVDRPKILKKAYQSFDKIMGYEIDLLEWAYFQNKTIGRTKIAIGDIVDGNLSDEMSLIYETLDWSNDE